MEGGMGGAAGMGKGKGEKGKGKGRGAAGKVWGGGWKGRVRVFTI
jgi:hypothetical protein